MTINTEQTRAWEAFDKLLATYQAEQHRLAVEAHTNDEVDASSDRLCFIEQRIWRTGKPVSVQWLTLCLVPRRHQKRRPQSWQTCAA